MSAQLSDKQKVFVAEYLKSKNATKAALAAGYSERTAKSQGSRLLTKVAISTAIDAKVSKVVDKLDISVERILKERARMSLYDIGDAAGAAISCPADIASLPDHIRQAVTGWKWDKEGNFVIQFADKDKSLSALEKHLGMYKETGNGSALNIYIDLT